MPHKLALITLGFAFAPAAALAQGDSGYTRGAMKLDVVLSISFDTYDSYWDGDVEVPNDTIGAITRRGLNLYAAFGITDDIDIALNVAHVTASSDKAGEGLGGELLREQSDLQDLSIQTKWRFLRFEAGPGTLSLLAAPAIKLPLGSYANNSFTAIGDRNVDLRLHGVIQYLLPHNIYVAIESGYDIRFDEPADEIQLHPRAGITLFDRISPGIFYSKVISLDGYDISTARPFPGLQESYDRVGVTLFARIIDAVGVAGSVWKTVAGKNTGNVTGFSVGLAGSL